MSERNRAGDSGDGLMRVAIECYEEPPGMERQHVIRVEDLERYVRTMQDSGGFKGQYEMLRSGAQKPCSAGKKPENESKNRYQDLLPYDESRVVLRKLKHDPHSDYINASYVHGYEREVRYICAQGPLENTVEDFWRLVWQEDIEVIAMMANVIEGGKKKCEKYWPEKALKAGEIAVSALGEKVFLDYTLRDLKLQKVGVSGSRTVRQYHYTAWPDHGVPAYAPSLVQMLRDMKERRPDRRTPWLLHCSAGVGRTGAVMVLDSVIEMSRAESKVDVLGLLYKMRQQRMNLIETVEQYAFVHHALVEHHFGDVSCRPKEALLLYFNALRQPEAHSRSTGLQLQFQRLRLLEAEHFLHRCHSAQSPANRAKNRDPYILPTDHGRPVLKTNPPANYINAVFTYDYGRPCRFIVTQYPLPLTLSDFWQLVWDCGAHALVALNEFNRADESCPEFWPSSGSVCHGSIRVEHVSSESEYFGGVLVRKLRLRSSKGKGRSVRTFHLHGWRREEFVPPQVDALVQLVARLDRWTTKSGQPSPPVVVTCYDGCRASGFFCASSYLAGQLHAEGRADVVEAVRAVRLHRPAFVPTVEQFRWLYELACFLVSEKVLC